MRGKRKIAIDGDVCMIPLTKGRAAIADAADAALLENGSWFASVGRAGLVYAHRHDPELFLVTGYRASSVVKMHRFLMGNPLGFVVDHINGDTLDNRRSNLRIITADQNSKNRRIGSNNSSGVTGVSWRSKDAAWVASIWVSGKNIEITRSRIFDVACQARAAAEVEYFGEFARAS